MIRSSLLALGVFSLSLLPLATHAAAPIDAAGAEKLKEIVTQALETHKSDINAHGMTLIEKGILTVEPKGTYYMVTTPEYFFKGNRGIEIDFGKVRINAVPGDKEHQWKFSTALPSPIYVMENGKSIATIRLNDQKLSTIYDEQLKTALASDAVYKNIVIEPHGLKEGETASFKIAEIQAKIGSKEHEKNIYDYVTDFKISGVALDGKSGSETFTVSLDDISAHQALSKVDLAKMAQIREKIQSFTNAGLDPNQLNDEKSVSAFIAMIREMIITPYFDAYDNSLTMNGLNIAINDPKGPFDLQLKKVVFQSDGNNLIADKNNLGFNMIISGLDLPEKTFKDVISPGTENPKPFIPTDYQIGLKIKDLPLKDIAKEFLRLAEAGMKSQTSPEGMQNQALQMTAMQSMMSMPALLSKAGTTLNTTTNTTAKDYMVDSVTDLVADATSVMGGTGKAKVTFTGMDDLITKLKDIAAKKENIQYNQAVQGLSAMQILGQQGTDKNGKPARVYEFTLDAQGITKLNGTDIKALMGTGMGGPAPAAVPQSDTPPAGQ
jgi:hypothetical protein